jgi:uncharacterized protein (DUF362 family)
MKPAHSRRCFLQYALAGGVAAIAASRWAGTLYGDDPLSTYGGVGVAPPKLPALPRSKVALTAGKDRADMTFKALQALEKEIAAAIGNKRVVIKPNNVIPDNALACLHADCLGAICEFLKSINKLGNAVIAESPAVGDAIAGFEELRYNAVAKKYNVKLMDLDKEEFNVLTCLDQVDMRSHPVRVSRMLMDQNANFIISAARPKTHDSVVATLSLKNIVMAAPLKIDDGPEKRLVHGSGPWAINFNLANLAMRLHPSLSVLDGLEGMEGNGPVDGTGIDHKVCFASLDWLAADRVGLELMGIDPAKVGYLTYCAQMNLGNYDLKNMDIIGEAIKDHIKAYKLSATSNTQFKWREMPQRISNG